MIGFQIKDTKRSEQQATNTLEEVEVPGWERIFIFITNFFLGKLPL